MSDDQKSATPPPSPGRSSSIRRSTVASIALPTQNQLFAFYMHVCGRYRIRKPNKAFLSLLDEDNLSRLLRREREAKAMFLPIEELPDDGDDTPEQRAARGKIVPLSSKRSLKLSEQDGSWILGTSGLHAVLDVLSHCHLLEELDLSGVGGLFKADAYKQGPTGNETMKYLADFMADHPSLASLNIQNQPIGTYGGSYLLSAIERNAHICAVTFDEEGVDNRILDRIAKALQNNIDGRNTNMPPAARAVLADEIASLAEVDRKTGSELRSLHLLIHEIGSVFSGLTREELDTLVLKSVPLSMSEVVSHARGLRGDEAHLYLIESGEINATVGVQSTVLGRGDYFGETLETVMFSGGTLSVGQRGLAFRIPFQVCDKLFPQWAADVDKYLPIVRQCAPLQALPLWVLIRACHGAKIVTISPGEAAVAKGTSFAGLQIVVSGVFIGPRRVRAREKEKYKSGPPPTVEFTAGDTMGEEALVTRYGTNSVDIRAAKLPPGVTRTSGEALPDATVLLLDKRFSASHIVGPCKAVFKVQAKLYSSHDDL